MWLHKMGRRWVHTFVNAPIGSAAKDRADLYAFQPALEPHL